MEQARLHAIVRGAVQGVGFRQSAVRQAQRLGLSGWVRNRRDGAVETVAEGPRDALERYLAWLHKGPPAASVTGVTADWQSPTGEFADFDVTW